MDDIVSVIFDGTDCKPEAVIEYVRMPSGCIVVRTRGGESYWFDADGRHPKSHLSCVPKGEDDEERRDRVAHWLAAEILTRCTPAFAAILDNWSEDMIELLVDFERADSQKGQPGK